jgi:hypothetical protein
MEWNGMEWNGMERCVRQLQFNANNLDSLISDGSH